MFDGKNSVIQAHEEGGMIGTNWRVNMTRVPSQCATDEDKAWPTEIWSIDNMVCLAKTCPTDDKVCLAETRLLDL